MTSLLVAGSEVLAAASTEQNNFGDTRSGALAGPLGLVFIILLGIATVLLIRNMNSRIRRLPNSFEGQARNGASDGRVDGPPADPADGPVKGSADGSAKGSVTGSANGKADEDRTAPPTG